MSDIQFLYTFSHQNNLRTYQNQGAIYLSLPMISNHEEVAQSLVMRYQQYDIDTKQHCYNSSLLSVKSNIQFYKLIPERRYYEIGRIKVNYHKAQEQWVYNYPLIRNLINIIEKDLYESQVKIIGARVSNNPDWQSLIRKWIFKVYQKPCIFLITNHNQIALQGHKLVNDDQSPTGLLFPNSFKNHSFIITLLLNNQKIEFLLSPTASNLPRVSYEQFEVAQFSKTRYQLSDQFWTTFLKLKSLLALSKLFKAHEID